MKLAEIVQKCRLSVACPGEGLDREVRGGYVSDLMSDVLAHGRAGDLWVTLQTHANIVAVCAARDLAGVVLIGGNRPEPLTLEKARRESVVLLLSELPAFEVAGMLYALGLRGAGCGDEEP
jgi:hypothetical protein